MDRRSFLKAAAGTGVLAAFMKTGAVFAQDYETYHRPEVVLLREEAIHKTLASKSKEAVGLRLVCLFDVSGSIDTEEYKVQLEAMASAIGSDDFRDAIFFPGGPQSIAICVADFGSNSAMRVPWVDVRKGGEVKLKALSDEIRKLERREYGSTEQSLALELALLALRQCPWPGRRTVVDMITDGRDSSYGYVDSQGALRDIRVKLAREEGATINALVTLDHGESDIDRWAAENLVTQPGATKADGSYVDPGFVKIVATQQSTKSPGAIVEYKNAMALAFRRKLILEVAQMDLDRLRMVARAGMTQGGPLAAP